ncbi:MAG: chemotaxis protein CheD [Pseudomonadota bacterium]|jgi:chemotaxis protein CheD
MLRPQKHVASHDPVDPADVIDVFLQPGDLFVGDAGYRIRTILGSCVSITLWHGASRSGGMSHFLLPTRGVTGGGFGASNGELDGRYGDEALSSMLDQLSASGVRPGACVAKIFGGGNMFPRQARAGTVQVGQRNGEAARRLLRQHGIRVVGESLYGVGHRQIIFDIASGDVWAHHVQPSAGELERDSDAGAEHDAAYVPAAVTRRETRD